MRYVIEGHKNFVRATGEGGGRVNLGSWHQSLIALCLALVIRVDPKLPVGQP